MTKLQTEQKHTFYKITFQDCGLDYDYTICEFQDIEDQISVVDDDIMDDDTGMYKPEIKIEPIRMTEQEYSNWFESNMNP